MRHISTTTTVWHRILPSAMTPASSQETKELAIRLRADLEAKLSQEKIEAAQQRAESKSLEKFVGAVLASD